MSEGIMQQEEFLRQYRRGEATLPENWLFPFRADGAGGVEQFFWRKFEWLPLVGHKDNIGYYVANWQQRDSETKARMGRRFSRVHQIVWRVYHGDVPEGLEIDHIDGDKANNRVENLRVVTHAENIRYARERLGNWCANRKLKPHQVELTLAAPSYTNWQFLADRWGVHKVTLLTLRCQAKKKGAISGSLPTDLRHEGRTGVDAGHLDAGDRG